MTYRDLPVEEYADALQWAGLAISQAVMNLIDNGLKYSTDVKELGVRVTKPTAKLRSRSLIGESAYLNPSSAEVLKSFIA